MAEKKIKGRKRHIATDIMGNLLVIKVHAANIHDTMGGCHVYQASKIKYPSLIGCCADAGYRGTFVNFVKTKYGETVTIPEKKSKEWRILHNIWRVERTFAWANWSRILSKDYEIKAVYQENVFMISHLHSLLKRY